jgi:prepilin-type N-terminal cleavage/methylation domain-containing protein
MMRHEPVKFSKGFTLVELLVAIILVLFLMSAAITLHLTGRQSSIDTEALSRMQENVRFASDYLVRDVRNAGFRDESFLRVGHEVQIREAYATILNNGTPASSGNQLRVRYAGRGHCTEAFDEYRIVENEYYLSDTGDLMCRGRSIGQDLPGTTQITDVSFSTGIGLVRGLTSLQFDTISVGDAACVFDLTAFEINPTTVLCTGVSITMQFAGMQNISDASIRDEYTAELTAAFRNVILDIVNYNAFASE